MRFWWVSQNKTGEEEIRDGFLWSPKTNASGSFSQFYENMKLVKPGDPVLSYRRQSVRVAGFALSVARDAPKPKSFDEAADWSSDGWRIEMAWTELGFSFTPKNWIESLRPLLPAKYSPIHPDSGEGRQAYLFEVPEDLYRFVFEKAGAA